MSEPKVLSHGWYDEREEAEFIVSVTQDGERFDWDARPKINSGAAPLAFARQILALVEMAQELGAARGQGREEDRKLIADCEAMLTALEWAKTGSECNDSGTWFSWALCPSCNNEHEHAKDCDLAAIIARTRSRQASEGRG